MEAGSGGRGAGPGRGRQEGAERVGAVGYEHVGEEYLQERQLHKHAGVWLIMFLGIGYVISGEYFSWNFGFAGGWGGFLIAAVLMALMYVCIAFSVSEMATSLPHTGGAYAFGRRALGPWGGFAVGLGATICYMLATATISVAIAAYILGPADLGEELGKIGPIEPVEWISFLFFAVFVFLNVRGVQLVFGLTAAITAVAIAWLVVWAIGVIPDWDTSHFSNIAPADEGNASRFIPEGISGIWAAFPFAIWFYLAIEATPFATEEARDPRRDLPRGTMLAMGALILLSLLVFFVGAGTGGARLLSGAAAPIPEVVDKVQGQNWFFWAATVVGLTGLIASFYSIIFAYSRQIFALSRAGYVPRLLSRTGRWHTPFLAILLPAIVAWATVILYSRIGTDAEAIANITQISVFGGLIYYVLIMVSFIVLRTREPGLERPYRSPVGVPGAAVAGILAAIALGAGFQYPFGGSTTKWTIAATIGVILLGLLYFALYSRHRLVAEAPEEEFAIIEAGERELEVPEHVSEAPAKGPAAGRE
jgi:ethanolamine permease